MANLNCVMLIGRLTRDPELKYTPSGQAVTDIGLAVNDYWTGKDGQKHEDTTFVEVTLWGRQAELATEYLAKGKQVFIEGKLKLDQWESKEGEKRSKLRVQALRMQFLESRGDRPGGAPARQSDEPPVEAGATGGPPESDIPF